MNVPDQKHTRSSLAVWSLAGFVIGAAIPCASIWPDLFARLHVASTGGGGESSDWGEPLFYMVIMGIPAGLLGAVVAFVIAFPVRRRAKSNS